MAYSQIEAEEILQQLLIEGYENEIVEFKEAKNNFDTDDLGQYFSALSNEANLKDVKQAWLVFGIRNDQSIVGSNYRLGKANLDKIKKEIANHTSENISFREVYEVIHNDKRVLLFEIPCTPQGIPMAWKGHYYGRAGESLHPLNLEKIERIRTQNRNFDWSAQIIEGATLEDLSIEAIAKARELYKSKNMHLSMEVDSWSDILFLNKIRVCIKGRITNSALLLLGKIESEHFIHPATAKISWILRDKDNISKDYIHFACPLLLNVQSIYQKIRNLKYRYLSEGTLFPEEVDQCDPYIIREALNNCIAHQDYRLGGKINIVEYEDGKLIFTNSGEFIPKSIEHIIFSDAPESVYRNPFLVNAMINLKMIDAIGTGIKKMFTIQRDRFFPMPDYEITANLVKLTITGKILDMNYAKKLASMPNLSLFDVLALDKVAKLKPLTDSEIISLKTKKLIEGRKPNFHISAAVANITNEKAKYIKLRGLDDAYYKELILALLDKFKDGVSRATINDTLYDKLPDILTDQKKSNKISNLLSAMSRKDKTIQNLGSDKVPKWVNTNKYK
jgi:ATP-dependent DNA helicase RecG